MPLLRKDGKPYKTLFSPNPLTKEQEHIDEKKLVFHNVKWQASKVDASKPVRPKVADVPNTDFIKEIRAALGSEKKKRELLDAKIEPQKPEVQSEPEPLPPAFIQQTNPEPVAEDHTIIMHCYPIIIKERKDDVYGDRSRTVQYGEKIKIEGLMIDHADLEMEFFSKTSLVAGTVVYPSVYKNGEKVGEYRWWKIRKVKQSEDGYIYLAEITEHQVDFS